MFVKLPPLLRHFRRTALLACIFSAVSAFATQVATPTFSPAAGTYASAQSVTISTTTLGATIRYTTDGGTPTETNGTVYTSAVSINSSTQLNAIAYETGDTDSTVIDGLFTIASLPAPTLNVLYNFTGSADGGGPHGGLVQGSDGNFYGVTDVGGSGGSGTVFKMSPAGVLTTLASFNYTNGANPQSPLVQGIDGNFYGTTLTGGSGSNGTVFKVTPTGVLTTLVSFNSYNGGSPNGLIQGNDGNFYGTTSSGGNGGAGTIFMITPSGTLTILVSFDGTNGGSPNGLVQGTDGNFYGTTQFFGGSLGTVFKTTPGGVLTTLVSLTVSEGYNPLAALVMGSDGNFYGTTEFGGSSSSDGTIFKVTTAGAFTSLVSFTGTNGYHPFGVLVQGSDGNFYGTTSGSTGGNGTIFKITPTGVFTTLVSFNSANGASPVSALVQGSDGNFYGTTAGGGSNSNGTFFQLILPQAGAPVFSPVGGPYTTAQSVAITSATGGASIAYTTDGSTPTEVGGSITNGTLYSTSVAIGGTTTLNAIAFKAGLADSAATTAVYNINITGVEQAPTFSPGGGTYTSAQSVTITSATGAGATIHYTTDGSAPTETNGTVYSSSSPVVVSANTTIQAIAFDALHNNADSTVSAAAYAIQAATPTFSPAGGTYTSAQSVTINSTTSGAIIRYTTDGSMPSETNGAVYSSAITVNANTRIRGIAYKNGMTDSNVAVAVYVMNFPQTVAPIFSPSAGTYTSAQSVSISTATSGATIRYTTGIVTPSETTGTLYTGPIIVSADTTINAIAFESGVYTDSTIATAQYTLNFPQAAMPTFSPPAGTYTSVQSVTISSATSGVTIVYTTDGSPATETHGTVYTGPVSIGVNTELSAIAFKSGAYADSSEALAFYTINLPPTFNLAAGTYSSLQTVTITAPRAGATVRYTTDGSTPTETNGIIYSGPISISSSTILKAIAYETGFPDSPVTSSIYTITDSPASVLNVLYNFNTSNLGGITPYAGLIQATDGNFYGTTYGGGQLGWGTVFKITPTGVLTTMASFNSGLGGYLFEGLVQGTDGNYYGTTGTPVSNPSIYTPGSVFEMTPAGVVTTLVSFNGTNGIWPFASMIQGTDGNFYGTTFGGGTADEGTVFKVTSSGALTTLVSFTGSNGGYPFANLVQSSDGNFYGTTFAGGSTFVSVSNSGDGTVFKMTPSGALTTLVSFTGGNGELPAASLVQGNDGNFYGTTTEDTVNDDGTVFKMTPAGALTTLVYFSSTTGQTPNGLVQGSDGNFYGTTEGTGSGGSFGTVFKITPAGVLTTLASFDIANGDQPVAGLVQGSDGNFYGTASEGGSSYVSATSPGYGVVFQLIVPPGTAAPVFSPAPGTYTSAQNVTITSATSGASIRYTTNGSTPTETTGTLYSGPMNISSTTTINAIAFKSGLADSAVISPVVYTIQATSSPSPTPTPTPPASSGGGGGGGGAFDDWFLGFLSFAGLWRALTRANRKRE